tara:strand:+ start:345 stop:599 length:255 start_codon:yes stop_codon:yes gene_type:complete
MKVVMVEQEQQQVLQVHQSQELVEEEVCHLQLLHNLHQMVDQVVEEMVEYVELLQVQEQITLEAVVVEQVAEDHQTQVEMVALV